jgi:predicted dehydrogenase
MLLMSVAGHGGPTILGCGDVLYGSGGRVSGSEVTLAGGSALNLAQLYEEHCDSARKARDFPLGLTDRFALTQHEWLAAVRSRRAPETSGREGLRDLACAYAILESAQAGRCVSVDEVASGEVCQYQRPLDERFGLV